MTEDPPKPPVPAKSPSHPHRTIWHRSQRLIAIFAIALAGVSISYKLILMGLMDTLTQDELANHLTMVLQLGVLILVTGSVLLLVSLRVFFLKSRTRSNRDSDPA